MKNTDIAAPDYFHKVVDCQWACPAHTPVPEYIRMIAAGRSATSGPRASQRGKNHAQIETKSVPTIRLRNTANTRCSMSYMMGPRGALAT